MNLISQKCTLYWFFMNILPSTLFILEKIKEKKTSDPSPNFDGIRKKKNFCSTKLASIHAITHSLYIFSRNTVSHNFISKFLFLYITCQFFLFHFTSLATRHIKINTIQKLTQYFTQYHQKKKNNIFRAREARGLKPYFQRQKSIERIFNLHTYFPNKRAVVCTHFSRYVMQKTKKNTIIYIFKVS